MYIDEKHIDLTYKTNTIKDTVAMENLRVDSIKPPIMEQDAQEISNKLDGSLYVSIPQTPLVETINGFPEAEVRSNLLIILNSPAPFDTDPSREEIANTIVQDLFRRDRNSGQTEVRRPID